MPSAEIDRSDSRLDADVPEPVPHLSVIVPCYNEARTLEACIRMVVALSDSGLRIEVIIVDDGSDDDSAAIAESLSQVNRTVTLLRHTRNRGKGAALRTGFEAALGDIVAIQDADLEYDPGDLMRLIEPIRNGQADIVLGSRFSTGGPVRKLDMWQCIGNRIITYASNLLTGLRLTDIETGHKVFRREILDRITVEEEGFGFEPEFVAKAAQRGFRICELGVSYHRRGHSEGKKIGPMDGIWALRCILRYSADRAPVPLQLGIYALIEFLVMPLVLLVLCLSAPYWETPFLPILLATVTALVLNYCLCVAVLFRRGASWDPPMEMLLYVVSAGLIISLDGVLTMYAINEAGDPILSKLSATTVFLIPAFVCRRYIVFPQRRRSREG